MKILAPTIGIA